MSRQADLAGPLRREELGAGADWEEAVSRWETSPNCAGTTSTSQSGGRARAPRPAAGDESIAECGAVADPHLASVRYWGAGALANLGTRGGRRARV